MKGFFKSRKFRYGSVAAAITAVVCALVIILNVVASALTDRLGLKLDLTPEKLFTITDETKEYLHALDKDVVIYILSTEENFIGYGEYYMQAVEVLKKYANESGHITLEFFDLDANPTFEQKYPSLQLSRYSILVTCGDKVRDTSVASLYEVESDYYGNGYVTASKAERVLTSAVLAVTSDKTVSVAMLSGHGEQEVTYLQELLAGNNYMLETVDMLTAPEIASEYTVAIIAGPERDYTEAELKVVDSFLENGGQYGKTLLYFAPETQPDLPNLAAFLADWGVSVEAGYMYESDSARNSPQSPFIAIVDYTESTYAASVLEAGLPAVAATARPLTVLFENSNSITTSTLLQFAGSAGRMVSTEEILAPDGTTTPYLVQSRFLRYDGTTPLQSQVLTFGSAAFVDGSLLNNANYGNSTYMLSLLAELTGREDNVSIQSKELASQVLDISGMQVVVIGLLLAVVFPLAVLITGLVIWGRRRHK